MAAKPDTLEALFGEVADGKAITKEKAMQWLQEANVVDGRTITQADIEHCLAKFKRDRLNYKQFNEYIEEIARYKNVIAADIRHQLLLSTALNLQSNLFTEFSNKQKNQ